MYLYSVALHEHDPVLLTINLFMRSIFLFLVLLFPLCLKAQDSSLANCIDANAFYFKDAALGSVIEKHVKDLPAGDFYMISQIHNSKIDIPLEQELLFQLHERGVYHSISEYPHSAFFLVNEYLQSGDTALLKLINEQAPFGFIKNVYRFNRQQPESKRIRFYGIDYELYNADRGKFYKNALLYIYGRRKEQVSGTAFAPLLEQLQNIEERDIKTLTGIHRQLQQLLSVQRSGLEPIFGNYTNDVLLILSAPYQYESIPKRDKWLFSRFRIVYDMVSGNNPHPGFLASFGASHVKAGNKKNITYKLKNFDESPVRGKVVVIGVQYFNGGGGIHKARNYASAGVLDFIADKSILAQIGSTFNNKAENTALLKQDKLFCLGNTAKGLNWLLLVNKQVWVRHWKWE